MQTSEIRTFYRNMMFRGEIWNFSRRHFRLETLNNKFVKLSRFENRINAEELRKYCVRYAPRHVYFSVLSWLFPERVGPKSKAGSAVPLNHGYACDIDSYVIMRHNLFHKCLKIRKVCPECIALSRKMTLQLCEQIRRYYSNIHIVFSGRRGFHVHVLDFDINDWTRYNPRRPIRSHERARYKFSRLLQTQTYVFDRSHFILAVDPMRILAVPGSLNGDTGLVCSYVGSPRELESKTVREILEKANPSNLIYACPEPLVVMKYASA
jgi:hypothetical protein